jgi:CRISPR/Cas system-associated exonuclease Cas4 (RecB family)
MAYVDRPFPELSWSKSRAKLLDDCAYKYYLTYYASHNGWQRVRTDEQRQAYLLKQLTGIAQYFGEAVHKLAEDSIIKISEGSLVPRREVMMKGLNYILSEAYKDSIENKEKWRTTPKEHTMLSEVYYYGEISKDANEKIADKRNKCSTNFINSKTVQEVSNEKVEFLEIEKLQYHVLHGVKNYVKLDCLYKKENGMYIVADWKTGLEDEEKDMDQLYTYALYLTKKYNILPEQIEIRLEYLYSGNTETEVVYEEDLEHITDKIEKSLDEMKSMCSDPETNEPLPEFSFKPVPSKMCRFCNFREMCPYSPIS